ERGLVPSGALAAIGGLEGVLARHADEVFATLTLAGANEARRILLKLVSAERTRARRSEAELLGGAETEDERALVRGALEALVRGRLVAASESDGGVAYELSHEALLAGWARLRLWIDEERETRVVLERLRLAALDWERLGRPPELLWRGRQLDE